MLTGRTDQNAEGLAVKAQIGGNVRAVVAFKRIGILGMIDVFFALLLIIVSSRGLFALFTRRKKRRHRKRCCQENGKNGFCLHKILLFKLCFAAENKYAAESVFFIIHILQKIAIAFSACGDKRKKATRSACLFPFCLFAFNFREARAFLPTLSDRRQGSTHRPRRSCWSGCRPCR